MLIPSPVAYCRAKTFGNVGVDVLGYARYWTADGTADYSIVLYSQRFRSGVR